MANKRGMKGSTGAGKGFSTMSQAGQRTTEDTPGRDPRTHGSRRYKVNTVLPGGQRAKRSHGIGLDRGMGQAGAPRSGKSTSKKRRSR